MQKIKLQYLLPVILACVSTPAFAWNNPQTYSSFIGNSPCATTPYDANGDYNIEMYDFNFTLKYDIACNNDLTNLTWQTWGGVDDSWNHHIYFLIILSSNSGLCSDYTICLDNYSIYQTNFCIDSNGSICSPATGYLIPPITGLVAGIAPISSGVFNDMGTGGILELAIGIPLGLMLLTWTINQFRRPKNDFRHTRRV